MTIPRHWLTTDSDPLLQLFDDVPNFASPDQLVAFSQSAALIHWPTIENHDGKVSIILRRIGREDEPEWRDHLALLRQLIARSGKTVCLLALNEDAAATISREMGQSVTALWELPRKYGGDRQLTLSRVNGHLQIMRPNADPLPARQFSLARLRRVASISSDDTDVDLSDTALLANGESQGAAGRPRRTPVIFVIVPNGFGLGHVTRMLAVAQNLRSRCDARVVFWSFSRAAGIIRRFGYEVVLRQTARNLGAEADSWRRWETEEFAAVLSDQKPDLVVQDSAALEDFVVDALARPCVGAARLALIRRGMWQRNVLGTNPFDSEELADLVLEPGDLASAADRGLTRGRTAKSKAFARMEISAPVTLTRPEELLDRKHARRALGLGRGRHCLISLGGDAYGDWSPLFRHLVSAADNARVRLVWARSPLAALDLDLDGTKQIMSRSLFPIAPYLPAFDGVVSSVGYNSFHELMQLYEGPVLFAPRHHSALDDQVARARFAESQGWAIHADLSEGGGNSVSSFFRQVRAGTTSPSRPRWRNGAAEIAGSLLELIETGC